VIDVTHQPLILMLMVLTPEDISKVFFLHLKMCLFIIYYISFIFNKSKKIENKIYVQYIQYKLIEINIYIIYIKINKK
jgi:hypothetical protein